MAKRRPEQEEVSDRVEENYEAFLASLGLGLEDSDDELVCYETLPASDDEEDHALCHAAQDHLERQRALPTLPQSGGGVSSSGTFEFDLEPYVDRRSREQGVHERHFNTRLRQMGHFANTPQLIPALQEGLRRAIQRVLDVTPDQHDEDRLFFTLSSNRLTSNFQGWGLSVGEWREGGDRLEGLFHRMSQALNSNEQFEMDDSFQLSITHVVRPPKGSGKPRRTKPGHQPLSLLKVSKKCVFRIQNDDHLCCARAIVTAKARLDQHAQWRSIRDGRKLQKELALLLHHEAHVTPGPCGYEELTQFSQAPSLSDYRLILVDADRSFRRKAFSPPMGPDEKQIILLHAQGHYDVITALTGFFDTTYVCAHCLKPYNTEGHHRCPTKKGFCHACRQKGCPDFNEAFPRGLKATQRCDHCHRDFFGDTCQQAHAILDHTGKVTPDPQRTICFQTRRCPHCFKQETGLKNNQRHKCGFMDCPSCHEYVDTYTHRCFIQKAQTPQEQKDKKRKRQRQRGGRAKRGAAAAGLPTCHAHEADSEADPSDSDDDDADTDKPPLHVFFDIEAMQLQEKHETILVIAETEGDPTPFQFQGEHCLGDFLAWLDLLTENDTRPVFVLAHNFQGYDGYFVVAEYHHTNQIVQQIRNGCKLLEVKHDCIRFIDSMSFFQMPLSAFPKTFGLTELKKGYFPHKFNLPENQTYVGPVPAMDYYMPESMAPDARQAFETWHRDQREKEVVFDFQAELVAYCQSEVRLLKEGCLTFKRLFKDKTSFNPFDRITIASACNRDLRMNRMIPQSIASEPVNGWRNAINQSKAALEWLTWCDHDLRQKTLNRLTAKDLEDHDLMAAAYPLHPHPNHRVYVQHSGNGGEYRIPNTHWFADGYCADTNTVYEFHGCFWHGCPTCYPARNQTHLRLCDRTMHDVHEKTQQRTRDLLARGYNVIEMWECEWTRLKKQQEDLRAYVDTLEFSEPLHPRDAFCGGRTNAVKLYRRVTPTQKIHYIDYTSLYPWVNKTCVYPKGHPTFISQPHGTDIRGYFGVVKCKIIPPYGLYHPVLPFRHAGKLTFPLCATCVETEMAKPLLQRSARCPHSDDERALIGTWCTPELQTAVELGYRIDYLYEVWHFQETCQGLFEDYVNTWLKIKQEASGWPHHVGNDEVKRRQYIDEYYEHEGIRLDYHQIEKNPGLRTLAKMMLNSMWGKFGQRLNKTQVQTFDDPEDFHRFLDNDSVDVRDVSVINDHMVEVHFQHFEEDIPVSPNLNVFVASFTTCWARCRLYEALRLLGKRVLYFDTDSVVFLEDTDDPQQPQPVLGDYLGEFTNELDDDDHIVEFVSAGPKNYGYKTKQGKVECKVRGFRLNSEGTTQLNYEVTRQNVLDEIQTPLDQPRQGQVINSHHIVRDATRYELYTHPQYKRYQLVFNKRVIDPATFETYPYGYQPPV